MSLPFELLAPEAQLVQAAVDSVSVPGQEGDFVALPRHADFMGLVRPGVLAYEAEGEKMAYFVTSGFAEITPDGLVVLAERVWPLEEITGAVLEGLREEAQAEEAVALREALDALPD